MNATCFNDRPSGAKQRFLGIYRELAPRMPQVEFTIFAPADCCMEGWFNGISNIKIRSTPIPSEGTVGKFIKSSLFWPKALASERFDLFEAFHLPLPETPSGKRVLTLHDVRRMHSDAGWRGKMAFRLVLRAALKRADLLITVSEAMKKELQPLCGATPIHVIPNGLDVVYRDRPSDDALAAFQSRFRLPNGFLLSVGHFERRKNYLRLIEAVAYLRDIGFDCHLIIVGNDSGHRAPLESKISSLKLESKITLLSGLSDLELRCAYALCSLFVFPSTYEGFGIPILEAMTAARPMALSDIPVFREITESQSAYFSPLDPRDIARAIERVLTSPEEQARLIEYGRERIEFYSYSDIAARYERLYIKLLGLS